MKRLLFFWNIVLLFVTAMLLFYDVSNEFVSIFSVIVTVFIFATFKAAHGNVLSFGFVFIVYNILMHFGFGIIHFLVSDMYAKELYSRWILSFLRSDNYSLAIIISALAFESFTIAWLVGQTRRPPSEPNEIAENRYVEEREKSACYTVGMVMLVGTLFYFIYLFLIGRISFPMTYMDYRSSVVEGNPLYAWLMVFYPTGLLFVVAVSKGEKRAWGIALFTITAIILLATGNKGEVFYAVLAALGVLGYQKKKLSTSLVLLIFAIMFIIIPVVTTTRSSGVTEGFSLQFASITDPFLEIGMQIRCLVFSLDHVDVGEYSFMYGYSYLRPICRVLGYIIIPFRYLPEIPIDLTSSKSFFSGFGFTQVAEGYLNFGIVGAMLVFAIIGFWLGRLEFKKMSPAKLCVVGSDLTILINASRNVFVFVPGQVAAVLIIYFAVKWVSKPTAGPKTVVRRTM